MPFKNEKKCTKKHIKKCVEKFITLVIGPPGSGKSHLINTLASKI